MRLESPCSLRYYHKLDDCPFNIAVWTRPTVVKDDSWLRAFRRAEQHQATQSQSAHWFLDASLVASLRWNSGPDGYLSARQLARERLASSGERSPSKNAKCLLCRLIRRCVSCVSVHTPCRCRDCRHFHWHIGFYPRGKPTPQGFKNATDIAPMKTLPDAGRVITLFFGCR